jgi:predicted RecA/RadA family phage recombinase
VKTYQESQAASVTLTLSATIEAGDAVYVNGWLGIAADDGVSGDAVAITIKDEEYQFELGTSLNPDVGAIVYVTLSGVTGHTIPTSALSLTSGAGKRALFKTTGARFASADDAANYYVTGILLREEV